MLGFDGDYQAGYPRATFFRKNLQKLSCKTFHRKAYFAQFCEFVCKFLSKIV